jgi:hypothetical protein
MPSITVRALNPVTNDPIQGNGQSNFLFDLDAVTQIISTRLRLFEGEWFLNLLDGLPLFQSILGSSGSSTNLQVIMNLISARIIQTPFVTAITSVTAAYQSRQFIFSAQVETAFGTVTVTNAPATQTNLTPPPIPYRPPVFKPPVVRTTPPLIRSR